MISKYSVIEFRMTFLLLNLVSNSTGPILTLIGQKGKMGLQAASALHLPGESIMMGIRGRGGREGWEEGKRGNESHRRVTGVGQRASFARAGSFQGRGIGEFIS